MGFGETIYILQIYKNVSKVNFVILLFKTVSFHSEIIYVPKGVLELYVILAIFMVNSGNQNIQEVHKEIANLAIKIIL